MLITTCLLVIAIGGLLRAYYKMRNPTDTE